MYLEVAHLQGDCCVRESQNPLTSQMTSDSSLNLHCCLPHVTDTVPLFTASPDSLHRDARSLGSIKLQVSESVCVLLRQEH